MTQDKKHLNFDLEFLDKNNSSETKPVNNQKPKRVGNRNIILTAIKYNWKKILIVVGIILFFGWVIFSEDSSNTSNYTSPTTGKTSSYGNNESNKSVKPPRSYNSLPNGTIIHSNAYYLNGSGELKIDNGTSHDALVKLVRISTNRSVFTIYIKANNSYRIHNISDGNYKLIFIQGRDWDATNLTFLIDKSFSKFRDNFPFSTNEVTRYDGVYEEYTMWEVTLYPVSGGTAETDNILENEFDKY